MEHKSKMTEFTDREKVKKEYYPEVAEAIKKQFVIIASLGFCCS
jgi:hypothetical protein